MDEPEFRIIELEYKQASNLIQRGTVAFIGIMKFFIFLNVTMMLLIYMALKFTTPQKIFLSALYISLCGVLICVLMFLFHKRMSIYVRQWSGRAREIEAHFGGRIFTHTIEIEKQDRNSVIPAYPALMLLYPLFGFGWILILYAAWAG